MRKGRKREITGERPTNLRVVNLGKLLTIGATAWRALCVRGCVEFYGGKGCYEAAEKEQKEVVIEEKESWGSWGL